MRENVTWWWEDLPMNRDRQPPEPGEEV
jgi:hypothetical protein